MTSTKVEIRLAFAVFEIPLLSEKFRRHYISLCSKQFTMETFSYIHTVNTQGKVLSLGAFCGSFDIYMTTLAEITLQ